MIRTLALLALVVPAAAPAQEAPVGGIGALACREVVGAENAPYLAQVGDWALGYLSGRLDAGQRPAAGTALSTGSAIDAVTGIAVRCARRPDMAVIDAVRDYAAGIFDEPPQGRAIAPLAMGDADEEGGRIAAAVPRPRPRPSERP